MAIIAGTDGDDTLVGTDGNDNIYAKAGNDRILIDGLGDTVYGGAGNDLLELEDFIGGGWADLGIGRDTLDVSPGPENGSLTINAISSGPAISVAAGQFLVAGCEAFEFVLWPDAGGHQELTINGSSISEHVSGRLFLADTGPTSRVNLWMGGGNDTIDVSYTHAGNQLISTVRQATTIFDSVTTAETQT